MSSYVTLMQDYAVECALYQEDEGFFPKGLKGKIVEICEISRLPGMTPSAHERLIAREIFAKDRVHFLVQIGWKIVSFPVGIVQMVSER